VIEHKVLLSLAGNSNGNRHVPKALTARPLITPSTEGILFWIKQNGLASRYHFSIDPSECAAIMQTQFRHAIWAVVVALVLTVGGCVDGGRKPAVEEPADAAITARVKAALAAERRVRATAVTVQTLNGVVLLTGFAESQADVQEMAAIARSVSGVRRVREELVLRHGDTQR
jgi:hyperosmotically inducible periplasmic protein